MRKAIRNREKISKIQKIKKIQIQEKYNKKTYTELEIQNSKYRHKRPITKTIATRIMFLHLQYFNFVYGALETPNLYYLYSLLRGILFQGTSLYQSTEIPTFGYHYILN